MTITGMLRSQEMKNMFSPSNDPNRGLWHFPNIEEMANHSGEGVQPVLVDDIFGERGAQFFNPLVSVSATW